MTSRQKSELDGLGWKVWGAFTTLTHWMIGGCSLTYERSGVQECVLESHHRLLCLNKHLRIRGGWCDLSVGPVDSWAAELWILWLCALCFLRYEVSMRGQSVCFWSEIWQQAQCKKNMKRGTGGEIHENIFCAKINKTFELFTRTNIIDLSTLKT